MNRHWATPHSHLPSILKPDKQFTKLPYTLDKLRMLACDFNKQPWFLKQMVSIIIFLHFFYSHNLQHVKKIFIFMKYKHCNINSENKIAAILLFIPERTTITWTESICCRWILLALLRCNPPDMLLPLPLEELFWSARYCIRYVENLSSLFLLGSLLWQGYFVFRCRRLTISRLNMPTPAILPSLAESSPWKLQKI